MLSQTVGGNAHSQRRPRELPHHARVPVGAGPRVGDLLEGALGVDVRDRELLDVV